ncbi:hypothetical protein PBRA_000522 [Plasmodiophora brassicae]|uniref:Uncharacterized protein n=1 Tax=Plasmodiophora brassicae TaxID=37360 RepID=A0A0G4IPM9_PLABS|nr:hypothetical protein PBRA_000522 [Plasmodiophora brassicae]
MSFLTRLVALRARALTSPPSSGADTRSHYDHNTSCWAAANKPHTSGLHNRARLPFSMSTCKTAVVPRRRGGDLVVPTCSSAMAARRSLQSIARAPALHRLSIAGRSRQGVAEDPVRLAIGACLPCMSSSWASELSARCRRSTCECLPGVDDPTAVSPAGHTATTRRVQYKPMMSSRAYYKHCRLCWRQTTRPVVSSAEHTVLKVGLVSGGTERQRSLQLVKWGRRSTIESGDVALAAGRSLQSVTCAPVLDNAPVAERPTKAVADLWS